MRFDPTAHALPRLSSLVDSAFICHKSRLIRGRLTLVCLGFRRVNATDEIGHTWHCERDLAVFWGVNQAEFYKPAACIRKFIGAFVHQGGDLRRITAFSTFVGIGQRGHRRKVRSTSWSRSLPTGGIQSLIKRPPGDGLPSTHRLQWDWRAFGLVPRSLTIRLDKVGISL